MPQFQISTKSISNQHHDSSATKCHAHHIRVDSNGLSVSHEYTDKLCISPLKPNLQTPFHGQYAMYKKLRHNLMWDGITYA